jgi:pimeloyl-ACP methyl ester carboxylesterase
MDRRAPTRARHSRMPRHRELDGRLPLHAPRAPRSGGHAASCQRALARCPEARLVLLRAALAIPGVRSALARHVRRDPLRWAHANVHYWDETLKSIEEAHAYGDPLATTEGVRAFLGYLSETMAIGPIREFQATLLERRSRSVPFPVPLVHIYAKKDPMVPPRFGPIMAERTSAPLVWIEEGSHFMHVDAVDRFLPPVLEFLAAGR